MEGISKFESIKNKIAEHKLIFGTVILIIVAIISVIIWYTLFKESNSKVNYSYTAFENTGTCVKSEIDNTPITCGIGKQKQERKYNNAKNGGEELPLEKRILSQYVSCEAPNGCPRDGYYSDFKNVGSCMSKEDTTKPITCGPGTQKQKADYIQAINGGSDKIRGTIKDERWTDCKLDDCIPVDGTYTDYKRVGACMKSLTDRTVVTCGDGIQKQTREYIPAKYLGKEISPELRQLESYTACELDACLPKQDATCSEWTSGPNLCECSADGSKYQIRQTRTYTPPVNGGAEVADLTCRNETSRLILCNSNAANPPFNSTPNGLCPKDSVFNKFPEKNENLCTPLNGSNRTQSVSATYTFPIGGRNHHQYIVDGFTPGQIDIIKKLNQTQSVTFLNTVEKLEVTFKRINSTYPEQYTLTKNIPCNVVPWYTENEIDSLWKSTTGCSNKVNTSLNYIGKKMVDLQNIETNAGITKLFTGFTASELMKTFDKERIDICYSSNIKDEKSSFMIIDRNKQFNSNSDLLEGVVIPPIIPPLVQFNNEAGNVVVLKNDNYVLHFRQNGDLVLEKNSSAGQTIMSHKNGKNLKLLRNGNLVITDGTNAVVATKTSDKENAHLHLSENGTLALIDIEKRTILTKLAGPDASDFLTAGAIFSNKYYGVTVLKNLNCELILQIDGNLVLYNKSQPIWATNTYGIKYLVMHSDSHLIIYNNSINSNNMEWWSKTEGYNGFNLYLTTSGYLIFRQPGKTSINDKEFVLHPQDKGNANYPNKLYAVTLFTNTHFDKIILKNGQYTLRMQMDGNLILAGGDSSWTTNIYNFNSNGSGLSTLHMQSDGNLVQYKDFNISGRDNAVWASNTAGNDGAYLHLNNWGYLVMRKSNNELLKMFYPIGSMNDWCQSNVSTVRDRILNYLENEFYNNSPWTLFSSKSGSVWELNLEGSAKVGQIGNGASNDFKFTSNWPDSIIGSNSGSTKGLEAFRGITIGETDKGNDRDAAWTRTRRDLISVDGYNKELDQVLPHADSGNWYTDEDSKTFYNNKNKIIKPSQMDGGGEGTNYIPGYHTVSDVTDGGGGNAKTHRFLIFHRFKYNKDNQAFVLYRKPENRQDFALRIYDNHPQLVKKLKEKFCNENLSKI